MRRQRRSAAARPHRAASRAKRLLRYVAWADQEAIKAVYAEAERASRRTGIPHEVDHIIPLRGKTVSGLHVPENLRVVPKVVNREKRNHFDSELVGGAGFEPATPSV